MNPDRPIVVGLGEVLWDILPSGPRLGGAPANFAAHAAALGANVFIVSAVGHDESGVKAANELQQKSVSTLYLSRNAASTGMVQVELTNGQPEYSITENAAWDQCEWNPALQTFAATIDAVCFGTLFQRSPTSRDTLVRFVKATRRDCLRILDINLRQTYFSEEVIIESLKLANVLKLNDEELPVVAKSIGIDGDLESASQALLSRFDLQLVALTQGARGAVLTTATEQKRFPAIEVDVVDTVGAGDAFTSGLVVGMLQAESVPEIGTRATRNAADACLHSGGMPI